MADNIKQRISLEGGDAVKSQLEQIGEAGKKAFAGLKDAADSSGGVKAFTSGVDAAKAKLGEFGNVVSNVGATASNVGSTIASGFNKITGAIGLAGVASAAGFGAFAISAARAIDEQRNFAESIGITSGELSKLQFAARQSGVDTDTFNTALTRLARSLEAAQQKAKEFAKRQADLKIQAQRAAADLLQTQNRQDADARKPLTQTEQRDRARLDLLKQQRRAAEDLTRQHELDKSALEKLGIAETDEAGNLRKVGDVLLDLADAFAKSNDSTKKAAIAQEVLGRGSISMVPFLNRGREGIIAFNAEAARIAPSLGEAAKEQATRLTDTFGTFEKALGSLKNAFFAPFFSVLTDAFKGLTEVVVNSREGVVGFAKGLAEALGPALNSLIQGTNTTFNSLREQVTGLGRDLVDLGRDVVSLLPKFEEVQQFKFSDVFAELERAIKGIRIGIEFLKNIKIENKGFGIFDVKFGSLKDAADNLKKADDNAGRLNLGLMKVVGTVDRAGSSFRELGGANPAAPLVNAFVDAKDRIIRLSNGAAAAVKESFTGPDKTGAKLITIEKVMGDSFNRIKEEATKTALAIKETFTGPDNTGAKQITLGTPGVPKTTTTPIGAGVGNNRSTIISLEEVEKEKKAVEGLGQTLEQIKARFPGMKVIPVEEINAEAQGVQQSLVPTLEELQRRFPGAKVFPVEQVKTESDAFVRAIMEGMDKSVKAFGEFDTRIQEEVLPPIEQIFEEFSGIGERINEAFSQLPEQLAQIVDKIPETFKSANDRVEESFQQLKDSAEQTFNAIVDEAESAAQRVANAFDDLGFADGGSVGGGKQFASGGAVRGAGTSVSDSIRAWLSNGEFVQPTRAVRHYGLAFMESIRRLQFPKFSMGGIVESLGSLMPGRTHFADGGIAVAGGGAPLTLVIDGKSFAGLTADRSAVDQLTKYSISRQLHSAGRKPNYFS